MTIPPDFPWRPRMLTTSGDTVLSVLPDRRLAIDDMAIGGDGLTYTVVSADDFEPDPTDGATVGATVGALAQVVREALGRPFLETFCGNRAFFIADFAPENEPAEGGSWPTMRTDGSFAVNLMPEVCGDGRFSAWLAAWNARPKESR